MKYKKHMSILLVLIMLFSTLCPTGLVVSAQEKETTPLLLEELTPETQVSMEGVEGELSLTFNQPVSLLEGKQIQLLYDEEGDGKPNDPVLIQEEPVEGEEPIEPHDGMEGDKGDYTDVLSIDKEDSNKVIVDLTYLEENLLKKDHVYQLNIYEVIQARDHGEIFAGLGLTEGMDTWVFDTETENEITAIHTNGQEKVNQGEKISLEATVYNQYDHALLGEKVIWSTSDGARATVNENTGEVIGVGAGTAIITAASASNGEITTQKEITVEAETKPLEMVEVTPQNEGSLGGTQGEISVEFNQPVEIADQTGQARMRYDRNKDGNVKTNLRNAEGDLSYTDVLKVDESNPHKVILEVNDILEEGHTYYLWILADKIRAQDGGELFPGTSIGDWEFATKETTKPLEMVEVTPQNEGSLDGTQGEISVEFNQPVEIADQTGQARMRYDRNKDGNVKTNLRNAEGDLSYTDVLKVDESNPHKVILEVNDILEEGHTYYLWILADKIRAQDGGELFPGTSIGDWEFNTKNQTGEVSDIKIIGDTAVEIGGSITLTANIEDSQGNTLPEQEINWSIENEEKATIEKQGLNTAKITGVSPGKVRITASLISNEEVKSTVEITVGEALDYSLTPKLQMQLSDQRAVDVRGINMNQGVVYTLVDNKNQDSTELRAYDLYGSLLWRTDLERGSFGNSSSVPAFDEEGNIYLQYSITSGSLVYAITPEGDIKWKKQLEDRALGGQQINEPTILDKQVIFTVRDGVYSLDASSGDIHWHKGINAEGLEYDGSYYRIDSSPVVYGNTILVAVKGQNTSVEDGKIQAYNMDGSEIWHHISLEGVRDPLIGNETVYVVDSKGGIVALGSGDGRPLTNNPLHNYQIENIYRTGETEIGSDGTIYIYVREEQYGNRASIVALNPNGTQKYRYTAPAGIDAIDDAGYLYYTRNNSEGRSTIYALDPYGNVADTIPGYDSTTVRYFNIKTYGNVLLGSRSIYGQWNAAKIQHHTGETPDSIEWLQPNKTLGVGINDTLAVRVKNTEGQVMIADELQWSSSDESILSVENVKKGIFKGIKEGTVEVTVSLKDDPRISLSRMVTVENKEAIPTAVEILTENGEVIGNSIDIDYKNPYQFGFRVKNQYGDVMDKQQVSWVTNLNLNNVTVDQKGLFKPESTGSYPLSVISIDDNNIRKDITVNVTKGESVYGGILPKDAVLTLPGEMQLHPSNQYGEPFTLEGISWSSADSSIAKVDDNGKVTAAAYGTTTITGTKGNETFAKEVHIAEPFGYEWAKMHESFGDEGRTANIAEDDLGNIYYSIRESNNDEKLLSLKPDGTENWNVKIEHTVQYVQWADDGLYIIVSETGGSSYLVRMDPQNGQEIWSLKLSSSQLVHKIHINRETGNVYFSTRDTFNAIDKESGDIKWSLSLDGSLHNYTVSNEGDIFLPVNESGKRNTNILKVEDTGNDYQTLETNSLEGISFVPTGSDLIADSNGVLYSYFSGTIDGITGTGVLAVEEGQIKWLHYFDSTYYSTSNVKKLEFGKDGEIYFTAFDPNTSGRKIKIGALSQNGNLLWDKEMTDLVEFGKIMNASGDFEVDVNGNIYMPMTLYKDRSNKEKSVVVQLNPQGTVMKYLSYNIDRYGQFDFIHLSDEGIYITGTRENYVIKLAHENTQEQMPSDIQLQAAKDSIVVGDYLDINATVYSQVGIAMADEKVSWSSNMTGVATVDDNGRVTAHKPGKTVITATSVTKPELQANYELTIVVGGAHFVTRDKLDEHIEKIVDNYKKKGIDGDWAAFAMNALGEDINSPTYTINNKTYVGKLLDIISASDNLGNMTEYERMALSILAGGYDPHDFGGMNLIEKIANYRDLTQGNNAVIWGLIAFDAADAVIPEDSKYSSEFFVDYLLDLHAGEGWALSRTGSDVDITSMAVYALAPYYNGWEDYRQNEVKKAVDEAVEWLKSQQQEVGGFNDTGADKINTESTAQVIMALTSIGIDPQGSEFTRGNGNPVSAMLSNQMDDGTFMHETSINQSDHMATSQALQALAALKRFNEEGYSDIFYHIAPEEPVEMEEWMQLINDINQLPEDVKDITLKHEKLIKKLRNRYNNLSKEEQKKVTNLQRLKKAERRILILKDKTAPSISTDLKNQKVKNKTFSFYAYGVDDVSGELTASVKFDGKAVHGSGHNYKVTLQEGKNTISLIVVDENKNKTEKSYTITYEAADKKESKENGSKKEGNKQTNGKKANSIPQKTGKIDSNILPNSKNTAGSNNKLGTRNAISGISNKNTNSASSGANNPPTTEEVIEILREEISNELQEAKSGDVITIDIVEGLTINADMLDQMLEAENLTIVFKGEDYTLSFNTSDINDSYDEDLNILLTVSFNSKNDEKIYELIEGANGMVIHLDHHGEFPVPVTVVVKLADHLEDAGQLYLYYYNENTGKLEYQEDANIVVQDGYAQFTITHASDYVLSDTLMDKKETIEAAAAAGSGNSSGDAVVQEQRNMMMLYIVIAFVLLAGLGILGGVHYKRKIVKLDINQ